MDDHRREYIQAHDEAYHAAHAQDSYHHGQDVHYAPMDPHPYGYDYSMYAPPHADYGYPVDAYQYAAGYGVEPHVAATPTAATVYNPFSVAAQDPYGWNAYNQPYAQPISPPASPFYGYYLDSELDEDSQHLLALYGASELFGQLGQMEPRKSPKSRGRSSRDRRTRQNGDSDDDETPSTTESSDADLSDTDDEAQDQVNPVGLNLAGASELSAQLASEPPRERRKWQRNALGRESGSSEGDEQLLLGLLQ